MSCVKNAKMVINVDIKKCKINKNIYGQFSEHLGRCIYEGLWVGKESPIGCFCPSPRKGGISKLLVR